jgi:peptidoglycan hydrolase CwlO-like protein
MKVKFKKKQVLKYAETVYNLTEHILELNEEIKSLREQIATIGDRNEKGSTGNTTPHP